MEHKFLMRACIVGLGSIGRRYAKILKRLNIEFDVVSSGKGSLTKTMSIQDIQHEVGFNQHFKTLNDAVGNKYNFWIIATPSNFHSQQGSWLLSRGENVFLEKPVAVDFKGIELLRSKLTGYKGIAGVGYTLRAHPYVNTLAQLIQEERFGRAISANIVWSSYLPNWHPWEDYKEGYAARSEMGGGVTLTCSHEIDLILFLFGNTTRFTTNISSNSHLNIDVDQCLDGLFIFKSGVSCNLHLDFFQKKSRRTIEVLFDYGYVKVDFNQHSLQIEGDNQITTESLGENIADIWSSIYQYQVSSYVDAVKGCSTDRLFGTIDDGIEVASICYQILTQKQEISKTIN